MASVWLAMPRAADALPPRGLCLIGSTAEPGVETLLAHHGVADAVLAWPCDTSQVSAQLARLMAAAPLALDPLSRTVVHRGRSVHLTPKECRLLQVLIVHAGQAVPREMLEAALHAWGQDFESNTLDVHVHRLRRKLPDAGIRAVRGFGYVLIAQP